MKYDPNKHHRRSIRLKNYDYSTVGAYFVTICVKNRDPLFGNVFDNKIILNDAGQMIVTEWEVLPTRFPTIELDEFVVMPNHFHAILVINPAGAGLVPALAVPALNQTTKRATTRVAPTLGDMLGAFKSITTHRYIQGVKQHGWLPFDRRLWQRNYWEHIIRDETSLHKIRQYIQHNPARWLGDQLHPNAPPNKFNQNR
jgi:REP element-mobilizing transposase RayT